MNARRRVAAVGLLLLLVLGGSALILALRTMEARRTEEKANGTPTTVLSGALSGDAASGRTRRRTTRPVGTSDGESAAQREARDGATVTVSDPDRPLSEAPSGGPVRIRRDEPAGTDHQGVLRIRVDDGAGAARTDVRLYVTAARDGSVKTHRLKLAGTEGAALAPLDAGWARIELRSKSVTRKTRVRIDPGLLTDVELSLPIGATITGTVRHREHGLLTKIFVNCGNFTQGVDREGAVQDALSTLTDDKGVFQLSGVADGTYVLAFTGGPLGFGRNPRSAVVVAGGQDVKHDVLLGAVSLEGVVLDTVTRSPIAAATVIVSPHFAMTNTDADGRYYFIDLPGGEHRISVGHDGFGVVFAEPVEVTPGRAVRRDFELHAASTLILDVRDDLDRPVTSRITFSIEPVAGTEGTRVSAMRLPDGDGRVTYDQAVPGQYRVEVAAPGYADATAEVALTESPTRVRVELVRDAEGAPPVLLDGVVVDAETGAPVAGARISLRRSPNSTSSGPDGRFRLHGRGTRPTRVFVEVDGYGIESLPVPTSGIAELRLRPAAELELRFLGKNGAPFEGRVSFGISARFDGGTKIGTSVQADARGIATFRRILPGHYGLNFSSEVGGKAQIETEIRPGHNQLDVDLR